MAVILRKARIEDKERILEVEAKSTPGLRYLGRVFELFVNDNVGELIVAELHGVIVACGKFTVVPDGSAWLEALRVTPECQGLGLGKLFYQRFFELAREKGITTMRMYTNIGNKASKGLAERFGFRLAGTFRGMWELCDSHQGELLAASFVAVTDPERATELLMPYAAESGFVIMNRTFYALTPELCASWAQEGKVYTDAATQSVVLVGARFMPEQALHIALLGGSMESGLAFARQRASELHVEKLQCMFTPSNHALQEYLLKQGFTRDSYDCIVMEVQV